MKEFLTYDYKDENDVPRRWSSYQQVDVVKLYEQKLEFGKAEFACAYGGRVFLFSEEKSYKAFIENPKLYLQTPVKMPKKYNIAVIGPRHSGKKTVAQ